MIKVYNLDMKEKLLEVKLYELGYCSESEYTRVVCVCKYKDKFVFCYNKKEMVMKYLEDILKKMNLGEMLPQEKCMKKLEQPK